MNILIRCDSSTIIGTGHVMRCLNFIEYTPNNKYTFLCRNFSNNISQKIVEKGHNLILLDYEVEPEFEKYDTWLGINYNKEIEDVCKIMIDKKFDELIIDHYGIDYQLEKKVREYCKKIIVITDIFNCNHYVDIYINYNCDDIDKVRKYNLNSETEYKIGVENIIINKKIRDRRRKLVIRDVKSVCITMGGSDPCNYTLQVIKEINNIILEKNIKVYVVLGKANIHFSVIKDFIGENYIILHDLSYDELIDLYMKVDLCIGSLSVTAHERYILGVNQICIKIVDNQNIVYRNEFNECYIEDVRDKFSTHICIQ